MTAAQPMTIERFIIEQEQRHPDATGALSQILYDLAFAGKIIAREVRKAGLVDILGGTGSVNVQGELVQKLDEYANTTIFKAMDHTGRLCIMGSEEVADPIEIPERYPTGPYVLLFDPLDGSSNIDYNVSIGTIFSIHRKISPGPRGDITDILQTGNLQVAAGYILYGSSTMMVYSTGNGVHGFTLDPSIGEFLLSHPNIHMPEASRYYSVNESYYTRWTPAIRKLVDHLKGTYGKPSAARSARYIGSLVADFHRNLIGGGIFLYPADVREPGKPKAKLRLLYEAAPLAFLAEAAGGRAIDGERRILDVVPTQLHQRTALFVGNCDDVALVERFIAAER
ncbi:MAG: class 1 fructose-bisphosphatase [Candidatus Schekmanbacteria bacterium]|nr:class 1 fructose-bisphosphatase [Candidatus Schekmanbacteria bacterium]